ncbi:MAG: nickel pincer cofactor biosynthesis protein LarC [Chthoniobacterales bacterium]
MKVLYLDCFSGISGDMMVGALTDLGVQPSTFEWELSKVELGDFHMHFERQSRQNVTGIKFGIHEGATHTHAQDEPSEHVHTPGCEQHHHEHGEHCDHSHDESVPETAYGHEERPHVHGPGCHHDHHEEEEHHHHEATEPHVHGPGCQHGHGDEHVHRQYGHEEHEPHVHGPECEHGHHDDHHVEHGHEHSHEEHEHGRSHREIRELITASTLSDFVKEKSLAIFQRIAVAEGKIHGMAPADVTFHEVGALDSIADIICTCVGIEALGVEEVIVSKLFDGSGWVNCAHGRFPVPSTATLEILAGIPFSQIDEPFEFITPTGAAIVAEFGSGFTNMPELTVEKVGYGIGTRKLESRPNVLRAVLGTLDKKKSPDLAGELVIQVETNLDDLSPEITGSLVGRLLEMGALDCYLTPVQMKKNRPGVLLTVLTTAELLTNIQDFIFRETTSFGMRMSEKQRVILDREFRDVSTAYGEVRIKLGSRDGHILQRAPEFESCRVLADKTGVPLRDIFTAATIAAQAL